MSKSSSAGAFQRFLRVAGQEHGVLAGRLAEPRPIGRPLHQNSIASASCVRGQAIGHFAERLQLVGEFARKRHDETLAAERVG